MSRSTRSRTQTPRARFTWKSGFWLPVVAAILIALALIPGESEPDETVGESRDVATKSAVLACPSEPATQTVVGQLTAGDSARSRTLPERKISDKWNQAGKWRAGKSPAGTLVVAQEGEGSGPMGFVAGRASKDLGSGQVFSRCPSLLDEGWFVGLGDNNGKSEITLANLGTATAVADVYWWSKLGPVEGDNSVGITIRPGRTTTIKIGDHVPGEDVVAAQIVRRRQQVSAIALSSDKENQGTELVLPQTELSPKIMLAGLPNAGSTVLSLFNPHDETVLVKARGIRANGSFDIQGLEEIAVKPYSTVRVAVPTKAKLGGHAIELFADKPIAATATVHTAKDVAMIGRAEELVRPSAVPVSIAGQNVQLTLVAPGESAAVVIEGVDKDMKVVSRKNVSIESKSSLVVNLAKELKGATAAVVTVDGQAFAGAWTRQGDFIASTPLAPAPISIRVPSVAVR